MVILWQKNWFVSRSASKLGWVSWSKPKLRAMQSQAHPWAGKQFHVQYQWWQPRNGFNPALKSRIQACTAPETYHTLVATKRLYHQRPQSSDSHLAGRPTSDIFLWIKPQKFGESPEIEHKSPFRGHSCHGALTFNMKPLENCQFLGRKLIGGGARLTTCPKSRKSSSSWLVHHIHLIKTWHLNQKKKTRLVKPLQPPHCFWWKSPNAAEFLMPTNLSILISPAYCVL